MEPEGSMHYELLREITDNFSEERLVGEGSFGRVYRGVMKSGEEIAVKLLTYNLPGPNDEEFNNEFCNLIRLKHPNTVKFLGYCYDITIESVEFQGKIVAADRIHRALCFEYLHNGSLASYLRDESSPPDWNTRYGIIRGTCEGLKYLHQGERPTFHLDLKPGNILLDTNVVPKLADFGLSKFFHENFTGITHNRQGTPGYIPKEYIHYGLITEKFDIFSLGVVMLEIVTGREGRARSAEMPHQEFIDHVQEEWRKKLETTFSGPLLEAYCQQIKMCTEIALTSIDDDLDRRPKINEIIDQLIESETSISNLEMDPRGKRPLQQAFQKAYKLHDKLQEMQQRWKLAFKSQPGLPIHTGSRIKDATGKVLEIILVDAITGSPAESPMELHIELVPLFGDFPPYEDWSAEEFRMSIVKPRQENVPLLKAIGDDIDDLDEYDEPLIMRDGRITVNLLWFTDDSSWVPCRKFRIGACVVPGGDYNGSFRIVEAMTEAFVVSDLNLNGKHYPPALGDPVWRLEMIDKDGEVHKKLMSNDVHTVQEFYRMLNVKRNELRAILGVGMTRQMWLMTIRHARDCNPGDKMYAYNGANGTIYMDSIFSKFFKIEIDSVEWPLPQDWWEWDRDQKMLTGWLILEAYEHRHNLREAVADMELRGYNSIYISWVIDKEFDVLAGKDTNKHYPPDLDDEVWRLERIWREGVFHKRLTQNNVTNDQDFLMMLAVKPDELRAIMGDGMEDNCTWEEITRHARTCVVPCHKVYAYSAAHAVDI